MRDTGRFVRWQGITIAYFGYTINVILSLSTASLGFAFVSIRQSDFALGKAKCPFITSLFLLFASILSGIWCTINRLGDFRTTAHVARRQERPEEFASEAEELETQQQKAKGLGRRTWTLFWWQVGLFVGGETLLGLALLIIYRDKLF
jgi:hypothetical protein